MLDHANDAHPLLCHAGRSGDASRSQEGLIVAVLEHAVGIFQRHAVAPDRGGRMLFARIDAWFASDDVDYPFAFVAICEAMGLNASYVRSGLREWLEARQEALGKPQMSGPLGQPALHAASHLQPAAALPPYALRVVPSANALPRAPAKARRHRPT